MFQVTGKSRIAAVIGDPIGHSMSPLLHNYWFDCHNVDGVYIPLRIAKNDLSAFFQGVRHSNLQGFNVTLPHKVAMLELVDELDESALAVGAVNTVMFDEQRRSIGYNTDGEGFLQNLYAQAPDLELRNQDIALLGAGGAANAIGYALASQGARTIHIINRNRTRADQLAENLGRVTKSAIVTHDWEKREEAASSAILLVNTTSAGMSGQPDLDFDAAGLRNDAVVADIVYNPLQTGFLARAKQSGRHTVEGLGMLLYQAVPGFAHWGGVRPDVTNELRNLVARQLGLT